MEAVPALVCACLAWAAAFTLLGGADGALVRAVVVRVPLACTRLVGRLAESRPVMRLLGIPPVARACDGVASVLGRRMGLPLTRDHACALAILGVALSGAMGAALSRSILGAPVVAVASCALVGAWDASRRRSLARDLAAGMPGVFRTMAMAMASGETLAQAIAYVGAHDGGQAGEAFERASLRMRCGASAEEALGLLTDELDAPGIGLLTTALLISQRTGSPLRGLFESSAALVERERELGRMLEVKTAQVRLSVRVVCLLPAVMLVGLSLLSQDFRAGLMTVPGMMSVSLAAMMDLAAVAIIRTIMRTVI